MEETALGDAYERYMPVVYARCRRILHDRNAALDATQEVFVRAIRHRDELRGGPEFLRWLYRVATNVCLNTLRGQRSEFIASLRLKVSEPFRPDATQAWEIFDMLRGLDERTQAIVIYVHIDGMTHVEAAGMAQVTERTVRNCLTRFLAQARKNLGVDPPGRQEAGKGCA